MHSLRQLLRADYLRGTILLRQIKRLCEPLRLLLTSTAQSDIPSSLVQPVLVVRRFPISVACMLEVLSGSYVHDHVNEILSQVSLLPIQHDLPMYRMSTSHLIKVRCNIHRVCASISLLASRPRLLSVEVHAKTFLFMARATPSPYQWAHYLRCSGIPV